MRYLTFPSQGSCLRRIRTSSKVLPCSENGRVINTRCVPVFFVLFTFSRNPPGVPECLVRRYWISYCRIKAVFNSSVNGPCMQIRCFPRIPREQAEFTISGMGRIRAKTRVEKSGISHREGSSLLPVVTKMFPVVEER